MPIRIQRLHRRILIHFFELTPARQERKRKKERLLRRLEPVEICAEGLKRAGTSETRDQTAQAHALGFAGMTDDVARNMPLRFCGAFVVFPWMRIHIEEARSGHGGLCHREVERQREILEREPEQREPDDGKSGHGHLPQAARFPERLQRRVEIAVAAGQPDGIQGGFIAVSGFQDVLFADLREARHAESVDRRAGDLLQRFAGTLQVGGLARRRGLQHELTFYPIPRLG